MMYCITQADYDPNDNINQLIHDKWKRSIKTNYASKVTAEKMGSFFLASFTMLFSI